MAPDPLIPASFVATQLTLTYILTARIGAIASAPVFTVPIAAAAHPSGTLDHVWPLGLSLSVAAYAVLMVPLAGYFHGAASHTRAARNLVRLAGASFLLVLLAALGAKVSSKLLVFLGALSLSIPTAANASFLMQLQAELAPARFGLVMGASSVVIGATLVLTTWVEHALLSVMSVSSALCVYSGTFSLLVFIPSFFIMFPSELRSRTTAAEECDDCERAPLLGSGGETEIIQQGSLQGGQEEQKGENEQGYSDGRFTWSEALRNRSVWLFVLCIACKRIVFPLLPYFFDIGSAYGASSGTLLLWFQAATVLSVAYNMTLSAASDYLRTTSGPLRSGGRNVLVLTLCVQTGALVVLSVVPQSPASFRVWAIAVTALRMTSQTHYNMALIVAKDMFGARNMALVGGSFNGAAIATGVSLATGLMTVVAGRGGGEGGDGRYEPALFVPFYRVGVVVSMVSIALLCCMRAQRGK